MEMMLHHVITGFMVMMSYMSNNTNVGIIILWTMDWADIFVGLIRIVLDCAGTKMILTIYAGLLISWFHTRLYVLTFHLLTSPYLLKDFSFSRDKTYTFMWTLLSVLGVLNYYWFWQFIQMGLRKA
jgi:hypothetical protein